MKETDFRWIATWVVVTVITFFIVQVAKGQTLGINGAGFFENRTEQSDQWYHELFDGQDWVLRVPGGAIAKFADPTVSRGWGLTYDGIDSIQPAYGNPEEEAQENALQKWRRKADAQPDISYLPELVAFCQEFGCKVIWVANIFIPTNKAVYPVQYLLDNGVEVVAVELGNETYSQVDHDFGQFLSKSQGVASWCKSNGLPISYPAAPTGSRSRKDHQEWNSSLQSYCSGNYVTFHRYYDGREFSGLKQPVDTLLAQSQISNYDFQGEFQSMKSIFPDAAGYLVTEYNTQPAELIGDTKLNGLFIEKSVQAGMKEFDYFCIHNGVSPDKYGLVYGTRGQKRNTSYYAIQDVLSNDNSPCDTVITEAVYITEWVVSDTRPEACNRFWYRIFHRKECSSIQVPVPVQVLVSPADTVINCDTIPTETGCVNTSGTSPDRRECKTGSNDDYLHPERFIDPDGNCYCDECGVIFDHRINTKFNDRIIPAIHDSTGIWIDTDLIDFYITMNGQTVVFKDVFNWCEDGKPTFFNTNKEVFKVWQQELTGVAVYTFGVQMIDRETGINVAAYWKDHVYMTLYFTGLW